MFQALWDSDRSARDFEFRRRRHFDADEGLGDRRGAASRTCKRLSYGENGVVEFYLAQVAEETGQYQLAIDRYLGRARGRARVARASSASRR